MSIHLALHDAATNCQKNDASIIITLKSGIQIRGKIDKSNIPQPETYIVKTVIGGWITVLVDEVAAVEAVPRNRIRGL